MPNHWHFVVQPQTDTQLTEFFRWLTHTHTMRWHAHYHTEGTGHLYQGRFKTFPIEEDQHLLAVLRYVERNALSANLCTRAEDWKYGSLWRRTSGSEESRALLSQWPVAQPRTWVAMVNRAQSEAEEKAIRKCLKKGQPYGSDLFVSQSSVRLQLEHATFTGKAEQKVTNPQTMRCVPILFGTDVACMTMVSDAELICESRDAETWLRRG